MDMTGSTDLFRRRLLVAGAAFAVIGRASSGAAAPPTPTPRQTAGPFYPREFPADTDWNLIQVADQSRKAVGTVIGIAGRVLDIRGTPLGGARIEIWQCDALGRYHYPGPRDGADPSFQGYGRVTTDREGRYRFRTIRPVPYSGRAPHVHFSLTPPNGSRFTTQMYVAGAPENQDDPLWSRLRSPAERAALTIDLRPSPDGGEEQLSGVFDLVLGDVIG
jgi:protocatechuate 3,4-dioxygenase beta subunit